MPFDGNKALNHALESRGKLEKSGRPSPPGMIKVYLMQSISVFFHPAIKTFLAEGQRGRQEVFQFFLLSV
jgi:hypothetical protein